MKSDAGTVTNLPGLRTKSKGPLKPWMIYDDTSADKQCEAYTMWLNYMIKPQEDNMQDCRGLHYQKAGSELNNSPTLKSLLIQRGRVQASQRALNFYQGSEMRSIRNVLEQEVSSERLSMRSDHDVLANVNLRSQMISLLMSYSVPWLKLGLETVFGESISLDLATETMKKNLQIRKSLGIVTHRTKMVCTHHTY